MKLPTVRSETIESIIEEVCTKNTEFGVKDFRSTLDTENFELACVLYSFLDSVADDIYDNELAKEQALQDGKRVWALAKIQDGIKLFGKDDIENYLLFCNPHLHGASVQVKTTNIRVVCNNTLTASLDAASNVDVNTSSTSLGVFPSVFGSLLA